MILTIPHFRNGKLTVKLIIDEELPSIGEDGYPRDGGFFLSLVDETGQKKTIFLSEAEASLMVLRLSKAIDVHSILFRQYSKRRAKGQTKDERAKGQTKDEKDKSEIDWSQFENE